MALYLTYLQPFREYLVIHVLGGGLSDYVWGNEPADSTNEIQSPAGRGIAIPRDKPSINHNYLRSYPTIDLGELHQCTWTFCSSPLGRMISTRYGPHLTLPACPARRM
jgi:hypothetical protein